MIVQPLTPERWPDLETLFDSGAVTRRCWCMYGRIGSLYRRLLPSDNRAAFREVVAGGPPPGLIAYEDERPVGWCQICPRVQLPQMRKVWRLRSPDDLPVWSLSCLYVRNEMRRRGVARALISAAVDFARENGAPAVEAYPIDRRYSPSASSTGFVTTFERLGFRSVASPSRERPIVRLVF